MTPFRLPDATDVAHVRLQVSDADRAASFYVEVLGLRRITASSRSIELSANGHLPALIRLDQREGATARPAHVTGLYHVAIRATTRLELAHLLERLLEHEWPLQGMSDHLVSEAIYLADPDGNGIELYVDRPPASWPRREGQVVMGSGPLDIDSLFRELQSNGRSWLGVDPRTCIGHVHLQVSDLHRSERFYSGLVGLDVTQRDLPGALFFSAGGYHHHLGVNVWGTEGAPPAPGDAAGLTAWGLRIPDGDAWLTLLERMRAADVEIEGWRREQDNVTFRVRDPDQIGLEFVIERARLSERAFEVLKAQGAPAHVLD